MSREIWVNRNLHVHIYNILSIDITYNSYNCHTFRYTILVFTLHRNNLYNIIKIINFTYALYIHILFKENCLFNIKLTNASLKYWAIIYFRKLQSHTYTKCKQLKFILKSTIFAFNFTTYAILRSIFKIYLMFWINWCSIR